MSEDAVTISEKRLARILRAFARNMYIDLYGDQRLAEFQRNLRDSLDNLADFIDGLHVEREFLE